MRPCARWQQSRARCSTVLASMSALRGYGLLLRQWRERRRFTQLQLAHEAQVSSRHLSYVENERSSPSRKMIVQLAEVLEMPLAERNRLLLAAGFAPAYPSVGLEGEEAAAPRRVMRFLLERHQPYPAAIVDPGWNVRMANDAYVRFACHLKDQPVPRGPAVHDGAPVRGTNALVPLFDPDGLRARVANFERIAPVLLAHLKVVARDDTAARETLNRVEELLDRDSLDSDSFDNYPPTLPVVVPIVFESQGKRIELLTAMTMLGSTADTVLSSLRLETLLPADRDSDDAIVAITDCAGPTPLIA